jgi:TP901 family phage tail tape measure protein
MAEDDQTSILKVLVQLRDEVTDPLKQVNDRFSEMAENFASIGMAAGEVFAGYEALQTVIEPAAAMQEQMVGLKEATLANADALERYKHQADEIGASLPLKGGAEEAMQAMTELYKTFRDDGAIKEQTETAAKLAVVMGDTAPLAAKVLSSAVQNLGDTSRPVIDQMKEFGDEIAVLQARFPMGSGGLMRMSMALRMLGTAAQVNNVAQKTMLALMAEGNRINLGGPRGSGPILAGIVNSLLKMKDGRYEMEKYGLQVVKTTDGHVNLIKTLEKMSELSDKQKRSLESSMGSQGANVALLIKHMDDLKEAYNEIDNASGQLDQDAKDRAATFDAQMQKMKTAWQETKESLGKHLLPNLTKDLDQVTDIINKLNTLSGEHPEATGFIAQGLGWGAALAAIAGGWKLIGVAWKALAPSWLIGTLSDLPSAFAAISASIGALGEILGATAAGPLAVFAAALGSLLYLTTELNNIIPSAGHMGGPGPNAKPVPMDAMGRPIGPIPVWAQASPDVLARVHEARVSEILRPSSQGETHLHYMEGATVSVQVGTGANGQQVGNAVRGALGQHTDDLMRFLRDSHHDDARRSFGNPALEGAR